MDLSQPKSTTSIMRWVLLALLPAVVASIAAWGIGVVWNLIVLSAACVIVEACALWALGKRGAAQIMFHLGDTSALLTAWLIALALPPGTPWHVLVIAAISSIGLAKHAYGGLGHNVFNPAMVGYAVVMLCFPAELAAWPNLAGTSTDALSGATLLTEFRFRDGITFAEFVLPRTAVIDAQQNIALAIALGGALLLWRRLIAWRIPLSITAGIGLCAAFGYDQGSSQSLGGWWWHMINGGTMLTLFFIATDPVTHPHKPRQQVAFGLLVGVLIYLLRSFGTQPDGIAFAILLANCVTPLLNRPAISHNTVEADNA